MRRTRVKICGITRPEDAITVVEQGADAIGLVFYDPSPRAVDIERAQKVTAVIPAFVTVTALFVNPTVELVQSVIDNVRIDLLQFHGDEDDDFCRQFGRPYIKALRVRQASDLVASCLRFPAALAVLLDSFKPGVPGGTGETFDWSLIPTELPKPLILAGGLNHSNVAVAIKQLAPFAVDISGGVEQDKGIKDGKLISAFMHEVQCADQ